jgi:hypothetical protein
MASLALRSRLRKTCCNFPGVAVDGWKLPGKIEIDENLRGLELMFEQPERIANDLIEIGGSKFGG